jgi:hypothetical protein
VAIHVRLISIAYYLVGAFALIAALFSSLLAGTLAGIVGASGEEGAPIGAAILGLGGMALMITLVLFAIPSLACGWGLWNRRGWARILAIILGAVALLQFPIGTLFGAYVLVVMFRKDTEALFGV